MANLYAHEPYLFGAGSLSLFDPFTEQAFNLYAHDMFSGDSSSARAFDTFSPESLPARAPDFMKIPKQNLNSIIQGYYL